MLQMYLRPNQTNAGMSIGTFTDVSGEGDGIVYLYFWKDGKIKTSNGKEIVTLSPYKAKKWYDVWIEFDFEGNKHRTKINNGKWSKWNQFRKKPKNGIAKSISFVTNYGSQRSLDIDRVKIVATKPPQPPKPGKPKIDHCCIEGGIPKGAIDGGGNINENPLFVKGPLGQFYLRSDGSDQKASPCVDTGSEAVITCEMNKLTTQTKGCADEGVVDMGYHCGTQPTK